MRTLYRTARFLRPYAGQVTLLLLFVVMVAATSLVTPSYLKTAVRGPHTVNLTVF